MTNFDYIVLFILIASVIISTMRGLVKEVLSLASWSVAFVVANAYGAILAPMLPSLIPNGPARMMVAFVALFLGTRILMGLLTTAFGAVVQASGLTVLNRCLGGVFGFCRGIVFVLAGVILCGMTSVPQQDFWKYALLSPAAEAGARTVKPFLPEALAQHVKF